MKKIAFWALVIIGNTFLSTVLAQTYNGKTYFFNTIDINPAVSERVKKVNVKEGMKVKKGDVLVEMDNTLLKQNYLIAEALVAEKEPDFKLSEMDLERAQELFDRTLLSEVDLQKAEFSFQKTKAQLDRIKAEATKAKILYESSKITAPKNGKVLTVNVSEGYYFNLGLENQKLMTLVNSDYNYVQATLKTSEWSESLKGKKVTVSINNKKYKGIIDSISLESIKSSKGVSQYPFTVKFKAKQFYPSGMPVIVEL